MATDWTPARVQSLVSKFGGIKAMAEALGHKHVTTVRWWVEKGRIPWYQQGNIATAAAKKAIPLPKWFEQ